MRLPDPLPKHCCVSLGVEISTPVGSQNLPNIIMDRKQIWTSIKREGANIVHITTVPETLGFLEGHIARAKSVGFRVHVLSSPGSYLDFFTKRLKVVVHEVEMPRRISPLLDISALLKICSIMRAVKPIIVHAHTPKGGLLGTVAAYLVRVPVRIYHIHGLPFMTASGFRRVLLWWSEKTACCLASRVLCVSHSCRDVVVREGICQKDKIKVLGHGSIAGVRALDRFNPDRITASERAAVRERYGIPKDAVVIGFVGRIVRDKGIGELVEAWKLLREDYPMLHLLVVGMFEPQDPVPIAAKEALCSDTRIHLTGFVWETPPLYAAMDIFVLPSYREGFVVVVLEASSMRLPVVATRVPGCVDAVQDGVTGILVPPRDARGLAEAIRLYLNDSNLRRAHGEAGRERVLKEFRPEDLEQAILSEYESLLLTLVRGWDISQRSAGR